MSVNNVSIFYRKSEVNAFRSHILVTHVQLRFTQVNCGSANSTRLAFYGLLLPSKYS